MSPARPKAHGLDPALGERENDIFAGLDTVGAGEDVDEVSAAHPLAATVDRVHDTVAVQALEKRGQPLLPVEQQQVGLPEALGVHASDRGWLEANELPTGLQRHDDPERMPAQHGDQ